MIARAPGVHNAHEEGRGIKDEGLWTGGEPGDLSRVTLYGFWTDRNVFGNGQTIDQPPRIRIGKQKAAIGGRDKVLLRGGIDPFQEQIEVPPDI